MFAWNFISCKIKFFKFGGWPIYFNCLHEITRNETDYHFDRNKISFRVIKCYVSAATKWNHMKENICTCEYRGNVIFEYSNCCHGIRTAIKSAFCAKETKYIFIILVTEANSAWLYIFSWKLINDTYKKLSGYSRYHLTMWNSLRWTWPSHAQVIFAMHAFFYKISKKWRKCSATHWGWTLAIWKVFTFLIHATIQQ